MAPGAWTFRQAAASKGFNAHCKAPLENMGFQKFAHKIRPCLPPPPKLSKSHVQKFMSKIPSNTWLPARPLCKSERPFVHMGPKKHLFPPKLKKVQDLFPHCHKEQHCPKSGRFMSPGRWSWALLSKTPLQAAACGASSSSEVKERSSTLPLHPLIGTKKGLMCHSILRIQDVALDALRLLAMHVSGVGHSPPLLLWREVEMKLMLQAGSVPRSLMGVT